MNLEMHLGKQRAFAQERVESPAPHPQAPDVRDGKLRPRGCQPSVAESDSPPLTHLCFSFYHSPLYVYVFCLPTLHFPKCLTGHPGGGHFPGLGASLSFHLANWLPVFIPKPRLCPGQSPHQAAPQLDQVASWVSPPTPPPTLPSLPRPLPWSSPVLFSLDPCPSLQCHPSSLSQSIRGRFQNLLCTFPA